MLPARPPRFQEIQGKGHRFPVEVAAVEDFAPLGKDEGVISAEFTSTPGFADISQGVSHRPVDLRMHRIE